jgi:hypothetical protein
MKNPTHTRERMHQGQVSWYRLGSGEALIGFASGKLLPHTVENRKKHY